MKNCIKSIGHRSYRLLNKSKCKNKTVSLSQQQQRFFASSKEASNEVAENCLDAVKKEPKIFEKLWSTPPLSLSPVAEAMPRSGIRDVMDHAWSLESNNVKVLHLEVGQPMFKSPANSVNTVIASVTEQKNQGYIANAGLTELREAILKYYQMRDSGEGFGLSINNICTSHGCVGALTTAFLATITPGDEVLIPNPAWPNYEMAVRLYQGKPVFYDLNEDDGWKINFEHLESCINSKTKMIVICTPSNPTGAILTLADMEKLNDICHKYNLFLLSDEIYSQIYFDKSKDRNEATSVLECANMNPDRTIVVSGVSKAFSMTGFRVGWLIANDHIINTSIKLQEAFLSCGVPISQLAAKTAIETSLNGTDNNYVKECVDEYNDRRQIALSILEENDLKTYEPLGAFYCLVPIKEWINRRYDDRRDDYSFSPTVQFCKELLDNKHVAVSPGDTFGTNTDQYIRISLASDEDTIRNGVTRLCEFISHNIKSKNSVTRKSQE